MKNDMSIVEPVAILAVFISALYYIGKTVAENVITKKSFIEHMLPIADKIERDYGIKPVITISQSAHESDYGRSGLAQKSYNIFGITAGSWLDKGLPVANYQTREVINGKEVFVDRWFRQYKSWYDSADDWARLISTSTRYAVTYKFAVAGDVGEFAKAVAVSGYATEYPDRYRTAILRNADEVNKLIKEFA